MENLQETVDFLLKYSIKAKLQSEINTIKLFGEQIGYGHMMEIASALWRKSLEEKGYPTSGAFVPAIMQWLTKDGQKTVKASCDVYDEFVNSL